jgi:sulfite reductase (NADPH) flavoprotein alpha-component
MVMSDSPGSPLTLEQWKLVQQLGASLTPSQARWLSGYFAGLEAGLLQPASRVSADVADSRAEASPTRRKLTILYGTETGNSTEVAKALAAAARGRDLSPSIFDMADYKTRQLKDEQDLLIVTSTYGEGDPPQPAADFFEFVEGRKAPRLERVRYAVLALGDSTYERYCEAGKRLDRRFEQLGAFRLHPRVDCDIDYEEPASAWTETLLSKLAVNGVPSQTAEVLAPPPASATTAYDKRNPFQATIIENIVLTGRGSSKETRHIELALEGSGLSYQPGDALGIVAHNDPAVVAAVLEALGSTAEATITLKGQPAKLGDALRHYFEITVATPRFLEHWAALSDASALRELCQEDRAGERVVFLRGHHIVDILRQFPIPGLDPQRFLAGLRPLQPRLYSIACSLAVAPDEAHLTVAPVRYSLNGQPRAGVASVHLADRGPPGETMPVYVQGNPHFRLPGDDVPIIMIGAGTGVAPYRAFLQEREARGSSGRAWLFFGERNFRTDFLYQIEWQGFLKDRVLTRMDVAFSRDESRKVYVQHRLLERARDVFAWLEEGAHVYVCGDAEHLAPDVHEALINLVAAEGRVGREAAEDYVRILQRDHRYQRDVY